MASGLSRVSTVVLTGSEGQPSTITVSWYSPPSVALPGF